MDTTGENYVISEFFIGRKKKKIKKSVNILSACCVSLFFEACVYGNCLAWNSRDLKFGIKYPLPETKNSDIT